MMWKGSGAYSGLWPTSMNAISGEPSAEKAALRWGSAALTSGHHDCPVSGRSDVVKVMKNGVCELAGRLRALAEAGRVNPEMMVMAVLRLC